MRGKNTVKFSVLKRKLEKQIQKLQFKKKTRKMNRTKLTV